MLIPGYQAVVRARALLLYVSFIFDARFASLALALKRLVSLFYGRSKQSKRRRFMLLDDGLQWSGNYMFIASWA